MALIEAIMAPLAHRGRQQLQRMLGYLGQFSAAVGAYRRAMEISDASSGDMVRKQADSRLIALVRDRAPLLVGKASTRDTEEWNDGPVVRLNILNLPATDFGRRCDVLYLNSGQQQELDARLLRGESMISESIARVSLVNVGSGSLLVREEQRFEGSGGPRLPFGGALTGIRALSDLLDAGARRVHLAGFDFYLTAAIRKSNHEMCAQLGSAVIWGQLDWVQGLYRRGLVTADDAGREVLEMSLEEYARRLEELYGDWSAERAPG